MKKSITIDNLPLNFGKYSQLTPEQVADKDPKYVVWMYDNVKPRPCSRDLYLACVEETYYNHDGLIELDFDE